MPLTRFSDPGGFDPDPDPTFEKKTDLYLTSVLSNFYLEKLTLFFFLLT